MLKAIKHFVKVVRMNFCRHRFVLMDNEFNRVSRQSGCGILWYRCPKCGKMFRTEVAWEGYKSYVPGWCSFKKRM